MKYSMPGGKLIGEIGGMKIYGRIIKPKKTGKERLIIGIRQDSPKEWRMASTLSYVHALDVRFEK